MKGYEKRPQFVGTGVSLIRSERTTPVTRPGVSMALPGRASVQPWNESGIHTADIPCIARTGHRPMLCPRGNEGRPSSKESSSRFLFRRESAFPCLNSL